MGVKYFLLYETAGASDSVSNQRLTDYKSDTIPSEPRRPYFIRAVRSPLRPALHKDNFSIISNNHEQFSCVLLDLN